MRAAIGRYVHSMRRNYCMGCMHSLNTQYETLLCVAVQSRAKVVILWEQVTQTRIVKMLSVYLPLRRGPHFIANIANTILYMMILSLFTRRSSRGRLIVKKCFYIRISACAHAHTLTRAAAAAANNENCALAKKLSARRSCSIHTYECVSCSGSCRARCSLA